MVVILMGVAAAGKTTVGRLLASSLGWPFLDADDYHPGANISKMRRGDALTDADREGWLMALEETIRGLAVQKTSAVLACSALKKVYRQRLRHGGAEARFVYMKASHALIRGRLENRSGHFMNPNLLRSQFDALEEPEDALVVDAALDPESLVRLIRRGLEL